MLRDQESLIDITNAIRRILRYTKGIDRSALEANHKNLSTIFSVVMNSNVVWRTKRAKQHYPNHYFAALPFFQLP